MTTDEPTEVTPPEPPPPRKLLRSRDDRVVAGVCGGIGRYFSIDPIIPRVAAVGLTFLGGLGIVLYLAAWALVPAEPAPGEAPGEPRRSRAGAIAGVVLLIAAFAIFADELFWWPGFLVGPFLFLLLAGGAVWWLVRNRGAGRGGDAARTLLVALAIIVASFAAVAIGFWGTGLGGGAALAGLLIVAGVGLIVAAFRGGVRWAILPALALALGVGVAAAADVDLRGDYGERVEVPRSLADLPSGYDMGAGRLEVDLRGLEFPEGNRDLEVEGGMGELVVVVPEDLCVQTDLSVGMGELRILGQEQHGVDIERRDTGTATTPRLTIDGHLGFGSLNVVTDPADARDDRWGGRWDSRDTTSRPVRRDPCTAGARG